MPTLLEAMKDRDTRQVFKTAGIKKKKSKKRKSKKSKNKMIGGGESIYDTQSVFEDQNLQLQTQLADVNKLALQYAAEVDRLNHDLTQARRDTETMRGLARKRMQTIDDITERARNTSPSDCLEFLIWVRSKHQHGTYRPPR